VAQWILNKMLEVTAPLRFAASESPPKREANLLRYIAGLRLAALSLCTLYNLADVFRGLLLDFALRLRHSRSSQTVRNQMVKCFDGGVATHGPAL